MRMMTVAAVLAITSSACTMTQESRTATVLGGLALGVAGAYVYNQGPVDADHDGMNEWILDDNLGAYFAGTMMVAAAVGLVLAGVTAHEPDELAPVAVRGWEPAHVQAPTAPAFTEPVQPRLPELPASADVLHLAQQVRALSADGHCEAAWATWQRIDALDQPYAQAVRGSVMGPCVQLSVISAP